MSRKYEHFLPEEWYELNPDIESNVDVLFTAMRKRRAYVPRGYEEKKNKECYPVPEIIKGFVNLLIEYRVNCTRSLREIQELIYQVERENGIEDPRVISLGGITQLFDRLEKDLGISVKELTQDRLAKLRTERATKAKAEGKKRPYHLTTKNREKRDAQKRVTQANKELKQLEKDKKRLKAQAARNARKLKLSDDPTKYVESPDNPNELVLEVPEKKVIVPEKEIIHDPDKGLIAKYQLGLQNGWEEGYLMEIYREVMEKKEKFDGRQVAFLPTPRQYLFLSAPEDIVLYGGAAGGGKSYAMVIDPLRYAHVKQHNAVIIRKTMPELNEIIDTSRELYPLAFPTAKYKETEHAWYFPSGAKIRFGYLDRPADKFRYQGKAFSYIGFDELSQHTTDEGFTYLRSRLRRVNQEIYPYIRATANPGSQWVYEMFIQPTEPGQPFILKGTENSVRPVTMKFIPAKLDDNPHLDSDGMYRSMLEGLPEVERRQLLDGDWLASNDAMFPEFDLRVHVTEPFFIPKHWNRLAGLDYGYRDPSAGVWMAINPEDGSIIIYDEFLQSGLTGREFSLAIMQKEEKELVNVEHPIDWSVYARTGHTGPTIAESMLSVPGMSLRRADKNREAGWVQIHEHLRRSPETGAPKIQIFSTCKHLIKQLMSAKVHKSKPNDLDDTRNSDGHWDLLDALRYGIMSRPRMQTFEQDLHFRKQVNRWQQVNDYFS